MFIDERPAPWEEAKYLQQPLPGNMLVIVEPPARPEDEKEPSLL